MNRVGFALLLVAGAGLGIGARQGPPPASELARQLQAKYAGVRSFTADFSQQATSAALRKRPAETGRLLVRKPGRMRWTYSTKKELVSDGTMIYLYVPADKEVTITNMPREHEQSTPLLFLPGQGDLVRDFTAALGADQPAGEWRLDLTPKTPQPDFKELRLTIGRDRLDLRGFRTIDEQGTISTITFTRLQENVSLPDSDFVFTIPKGVDVIKK